MPRSYRSRPRASTAWRGNLRPLAASGHSRVFGYEAGSAPLAASGNAWKRPGRWDRSHLSFTPRWAGLRRRRSGPGWTRSVRSQWFRRAVRHPH